MTQHPCGEGKICMVTGASSGIGKETALGLARAGARVVLVCRDGEKGRAAADEIRAATGSSSVDLLVADLSSKDAIREAARVFASRHARLDVLINNAGVVLGDRRESVDGVEMTVATNYLAPFLLTHCLLPMLRASTPSRVINVSSEMHLRGTLDLHDPEGRRKNYGFLDTYARSKLMLYIFSFELARRLRRTGVTVVSVQPGIVYTNLGANNALPTYFVKTRPAAPNPLSLDPGVAHAIWHWSEDKVNLSRAARIPAIGYLAAQARLFPAPHLVSA